MRNKQVLLGFNRDPQKVQQYTCSSIEDKMEDATRGTSAGHGTNGHAADQINKLKSKALAQLENPTRKSNSKVQLEIPTRNPNSVPSLSHFIDEARLHTYGGTEGTFTVAQKGHLDCVNSFY